MKAILHGCCDVSSSCPVGRSSQSFVPCQSVSVVYVFMRVFICLFFFCVFVWLIELFVCCVLVSLCRESASSFSFSTCHGTLP